jgi:hypothetical protein
MVQNLIHIKDVINNKEFIYNTEYNLESGFLKCIDSIKKRENIKEDNIIYKIYENYCEIYYYEEIKKKGWIWNYKSLEKNIVYILTYIPLYTKVEPIIEPLTNNMSTQTDNIDRSEYKKLDSESSDNYDSDDTDSEKEYNLGIDIFDELKLPLLETINWCYNELEPVIENFNNLNLGNGYANTPFFPKDLEIELKNKLSKPNYGLKSINN